MQYRIMAELREPVMPENSTVLGSNVTAESELWKCLDWNRVRTDSGPHALHPEASEYLHVGAYKPSDGMQYRVRCRYQIGKRLRGKWPIRTIHVREIEGRWHWVIGYEGP